MKSFHDLTSFLATLPANKAVAASFAALGSEFNLTRAEAIAEFKRRGYFVAADGGTLCWARTQAEIDRVIDGGDYTYVGPNT